MEWQKVKRLNVLSLRGFTEAIQQLSNRDLIELSREWGVAVFDADHWAQLATVLADRLERTGCARPAEMTEAEQQATAERVMAGVARVAAAQERLEQRLAADFEPAAQEGGEK